MKIALFVAKVIKKEHAISKEGMTRSMADLFPPRMHTGSCCPLEREPVILLPQGGKNTLETVKRLKM